MAKYATSETAPGKKKRSRPRRGPRFFLNPYEDQAFTRCPRCGRAPTRVRKTYLVIHIEPNQLFVLNKVCRLCERCDLLIVKRSELESLMAYGMEQHDPSVIGNEYLVLGTLERADGVRARDGTIDPSEIVERTKLFREDLQFEPAPRWVWVPPETAARK